MTVLKTWETTNPTARASHAAIDGETQPYDEPFSIGLMYPGDPTGPPEEVINCDCLISISGVPDTTPEFETVDKAATYVGARYGYGDFTGVDDIDLETLQGIIEHTDRLTSDFALTDNFRGLASYLAPAAPSLTANSWGSLADGVIWMNNRNRLLSQGTGGLGTSGFTAEKTGVDSFIHQFGHLTFETGEHLGVETIWDRVREQVYGGGEAAEIAFMQDTESIWAGARDRREGFATVFYRLNAPHGLRGLSKAAVKRLKRLADLTNEAVDRAVL
jgi:hypothetical protein